MKTPEDQRIAIAELCGWVWYRLPTTWGPGRRYRCLFHPAVHEYEGQLKEWLVRADGTEAICNWTYLWKEGMVPDYLKDLNAMREVEKALPDSYFGMLYDVCNPAGPIGCVDMDRTDQGWARTCNATAAQRAEAFLRVKGKWVE